MFFVVIGFVLFVCFVELFVCLGFFLLQICFTREVLSDVSGATQELLTCRERDGAVSAKGLLECQG